MAKQIIITKGDKGIFIDIQLIDSSKSSVSITDYSLKIYITRPDKVVNELNQSNILIINAALGKIRLTIDEVNTDVIGTYGIFVEIDGIESIISANQAINYTVISKNGGA